MYIHIYIYIYSVFWWRLGEAGQRGVAIFNENPTVFFFLKGIQLLCPTFPSISCGVATMSRLLENIGLFCKRAIQKRPIFCKRDLRF